MSDAGDGELWYFAYGANMCPDVLRTRRGLRPASSEPACLEGFRLVFDQPGIPLLEPAFANVRPEAGACVHGVLHRLTCAQLAELDRFEGGGHAYEHLVATVVGARSGPVEAHLYRSRRTERGLKPSRRYLEILCAGARAHGLPDDYVRALAATDTTHLPLLSRASPRLIAFFDRLHQRGANLVPVFEAMWRLRARLRGEDPRRIDRDREPAAPDTIATTDTTDTGDAGRQGTAR